MIAAAAGATVAVSAYPDLMTRTVTVNVTHRAITKAITGGTCGIWHHQDITADQAAALPTDHQPTPKYTPAGWVACWQHPTGTPCPGPQNHDGTAGNDIVQPLLWGIVASFQSCHHDTLTACQDVWWRLPDGVMLDGYGQVITHLLAGLAHHIEHDGAAALLPPVVPDRPGVGVVLGMFAAHRAGNPVAALERWGEMTRTPPGLPPADRAAWAQSLTRSVTRALTISAGLLRAAHRTIHDLPAAVPCAAGPCPKENQ
jgi:hypothetical protein